MIFKSIAIINIIIILWSIGNDYDKEKYLAVVIPFNMFMVYMIFFLDTLAIIPYLEDWVSIPKIFRNYRQII